MKTFIAFLLLLFSCSTFAQQTEKWGDQGDGTYRNPVLPSDFSDPDVIRVGSDYYGISSTLQESPGMVIIHSKDLVNWEIIGHVVDDISTLGEGMNWNVMNEYNEGIYAGSLRFHDNKFYCFFTAKNYGWYVAVANRPEGPWEITQMTDMEGRKLRGNGWDDNCPLWDDDGNAYIVASNFGKYEWCPRFFKMSPDGKQLLDGRIAENSDSTKYVDIIGGYVTHPFRTSEANKMFKRNGYYYFFFSEVRNVDGFAPRIPVLLRSKNIYGPYELKEVLHSQGYEEDYEPNQGSFVDTPDGKDWYFVTHHGTGHFSGRFLSVLPMKWVNDWPEIGKDIDNDGVGEMVWSAQMPLQTKTKLSMQSDDDFSTATLGVQWEWNHQPRADKWSLTERPGYLRLRAFKPLKEGEFFKAGNTIGQRYFRSAKGVATTKIEIDNMANGQQAGLCHFEAGNNVAALCIEMKDGVKTLVYKMFKDEKLSADTKGIVLPKKLKTIYLRLNADFEGKCCFEYSFNNVKFIPLGGISQLIWGMYRGARLGIFNYNNLQDAGFIDVDWFFYKK